MRDRRPNILWIMTDHQRVDSLGCYGSTWAHSPNFDRLAARGVRFANCTTQSPICVPSRVAQLTGRYPHAVDILENEFRPFPEEVPLTWLFRDAGYQVVNLGRCNWPDKSRHPFPHHEPGPGPGAAGATLSRLAEGYDPVEYDVVDMPAAVPDGSVIIGGRFPLPREENEPELAAARCEQFLSREAEPPFLIRFSISAPHTPVLPAEQFFGRTAPDAIRIPTPAEPMHTRLPRYDDEVLRRYQGYLPLTEGQVRQARGNFYDLCAEIDDVVGSVIDALERCGYGENTIIAFNSDHGTLLGEHGLGQNRMLYGPVVHVPFILCGPGLLPENRVVADPVELVDFFPTLMALAGIPVPENVHGQNLLPQIAGKSEGPGRPAFSEIDYTRAIPEVIRTNASHRVMVRQGHWELVYSLSDGGYGEDGALFDLEADAHELTNLYDDPNHEDTVRKLKDIVNQWRARTQTQ